MSKNDNTILWIIGIVILVFLILPNFQTSKETGIIGLTPHYYKEGVEIFPQFSLWSFSIVTPPGGSYDQIAFEISGTNTGVSIDLKIVDASPLAFKNALPITTQSLLAGQTKILWTSDPMDTIQFEAISPVNFWVNISGENPELGIVYEAKSSGDITFEPELLTSTQTLFQQLFSIVDFGGQTYVNDRGFIDAGSATLTDYTGSGYYTGLWIASRYRDASASCKVFIDGTEYLNLYGIEDYTIVNNIYIDNSIVRFENSLKVYCAGSSMEYWRYSISYMTD